MIAFSMGLHLVFFLRCNYYHATLCISIHNFLMSSQKENTQKRKLIEEVDEKSEAHKHIEA